jgi:hypothetical protein
MRIFVFLLFISNSFAQMPLLDNRDESNINAFFGTEKNLKSYDERLKLWNEYGDTLIEYKRGLGEYFEIVNNPTKEKVAAFEANNEPPGKVITYLNMMRQVSEDASVHFYQHCRDLTLYKKNQKTCDKMNKLVNTSKKEMKDLKELNESAGFQRELTAINSRGMTSDFDRNIKNYDFNYDKRKQNEMIFYSLNKSEAIKKAKEYSKDTRTPEEIEKQKQEVANIFSKCAKDLSAMGDDESNLLVQNAQMFADQAKAQCKFNIDESKPMSDIDALSMEMNKISFAVAESTAVHTDTQQILDLMNRENVADEKKKSIDSTNSTALGILFEVQDVTDKAMAVKREKHIRDLYLKKADRIKGAKRIKEQMRNLENYCGKINQKVREIKNKVDPNEMRFNTATTPAGVTIRTSVADDANKRIKKAVDEYKNSTIKVNDIEFTVQEGMESMISDFYSNPDVTDILMSKKFKKSVGLKIGKIQDRCFDFGKPFSEDYENTFNEAVLEEANDEMAALLRDQKRKVSIEMFDLIHMEPGDKKTKKSNKIIQEYVKSHPIAVLNYIQKTNKPYESSLVCSALIANMQDEQFREKMDYILMGGAIVVAIAAVPVSGGSSLAAIGMVATAGIGEAIYIGVDRIHRRNQEKKNIRMAAISNNINKIMALEEEKDINKKLTWDYVSAFLALGGGAWDATSFIAKSGKKVMQETGELSLKQLRAIEDNAARFNKDTDKIIAQVKKCLNAQNFDECMAGGSRAVAKAKTNLSDEVGTLAKDLNIKPEALTKWMDDAKLDPTFKPYLDEITGKASSLSPEDANKARELVLQIMAVKHHKYGATADEIASSLDGLFTRCKLR